MGRCCSALLAVLGSLVLAPAALADVSDSTNWAGYAVHAPGVSFRSVSATWVQPAPSCQAGRQAFSSYWIGLGGFVGNSPALEQIGTEADCSHAGRVLSTAWYESVPSPSFGIPHPVRPGDLMLARVTVRGHAESLTLRDSSRGWTFTRTVRADAIDTSSAEWIVEAPSECESTCQILPLADFGSISFGSASATTVRGHTGTISDPRWQRTRVLLRPDGRRFLVDNGRAPGADPGSLGSNGSAFSVQYTLVSLLRALVALARQPIAHLGHQQPLAHLGHVVAGAPADAGG